MGSNAFVLDIKDKTSGSDKQKDKRDKQKSTDKDNKPVVSVKPEEDVLKTVSYDPRFPNQNQTRNCYQNYLDYHRCLKVKDQHFCEYYRYAYRELCPKAWYEKWDDQRANGVFPGTI